MRGGYGAREFYDVSLSFISIEVCGKERETCVEKNRYVSRSLEGWGMTCGFYALLPLPLVS